MILGLLPPSSIVRCFIVSAPVRMMPWPTPVEPVKAILSTRVIADQRVAERSAGPRDQIVNAGWHARVKRDLCEGERGERCVRCGLM